MNPGWGLCERLWHAAFFPKAKPILARKTDPGADPLPWNLILAPVEGVAILLWPVQSLDLPGGRVVYTPTVDEGAKPILTSCTNIAQWQWLQCQWATPLYVCASFGHDALVERALSGANAKLVLLPDHAPGSALEIAAKNCFFNMSEPLVRRYATTVLTDVDSRTKFTDILTKLLLFILGDLEPEALLDILLLRAPPSSDMDELLRHDDLFDHVDPADRPSLQKEQKTLKKTSKKHMRFFRSLRPLRKTVRDRQTERVAETYAPYIANGVKDFPSDASWTLEAMRLFAPPGSHVGQDNIQARWRGSWSFGNKGTVSRAWGLYGIRGAGIIVLQVLWRAYQHARGVVCPIPGIFPDAPPDAEAGPDPPGAAPAAKAKARGGRGRGRGARGRGGHGRGIAAEAAAPPAHAAPGLALEGSEPAAAAAPDDGQIDAGSSDSSSSSSSSSSS